MFFEFISNIFRFFLKASKEDRKFLLGILPASSPLRSFQSYLYSIFLNFIFRSQTKNKNALDFFQKSQLEQIRVITMFSKKVLEKCNKEELNAKLLETHEKIQEKDNIITKLEKDLVNYEMQKLTVVHQKETIDRMEKDIKFFKTQTSKDIDNLLERQETSKGNSRVDPPVKIYQPKMVPRFAKQLVISDSTIRKVNQHDLSQ